MAANQTAGFGDLIEANRRHLTPDSLRSLVIAANLWFIFDVHGGELVPVPT